MSLNHLLDDDDDVYAPDGVSGDERLMQLLQEEEPPPTPAPINTHPSSSVEINSNGDITDYFDAHLSVGGADGDGPRELEWEDESDVNMVLRATGGAGTPRSLSFSPKGSPMAPPAPPSLEAGGGLTATLEIPPTDADAHCTFTQEVIGVGEGDDSARYEELLPGLYFVGIHRVDVRRGQRACLIVVRPDVAANTILDLVEQVLMSFGGAVAHYTHHDVLPLPQIAAAKPGAGDASGPAYPQQVREIRGVANSDCWDSISVFLGTDVYKRRVLCILATPLSTASIGSAVAGMLGGGGAGVYSWLAGAKGGGAPEPSTPNSGMVKRTAEDMAQAEAEGASAFESVVLSLVGSLIGALEDECMTAAHIGEGAAAHLSKYAAGRAAGAGGAIDSVLINQMNGLGSPGAADLQYHPPADLVQGTTGADGGRMLESLVDPLFVRDLMGSYAQELRYNLEAVGVSLDTFVAKLEKQCARLMTTMKPVYQRSGLAVPQPPVKKPLSSFPLVMPDSQSFLVSSVVAEEAAGVGVNLARLMILRARRAYMNSQKAAAGEGCGRASAVGAGALSELRFVLTHIFRQLRIYSETEARARVLRKTDAVTARITDIENYRLQLLRALHKRFDCTVSVVSSADNFTSVDKVVPAPALSASEKDSMALFISRFRIATYEEPPLLDYPACFFGMMPAGKGPGNSDKPSFTMVSRWGHMYITHKDIFFHADAAAMSTVMGLFSKSSTTSDAIQLVLPIGTIAKCQCGAKITASIAAVLGKKRDSAMELRDSAGNVYMFGMPSGSPPQYADRVCDLLTILQSCVFSGHDLNSPVAASVPDEAVLSAADSDSGSKATSLLSPQTAPLVSTPISSSGSAPMSTKNGENISNKEEGSILSSRKEAFSHVMKLASSALDSALPGKFRPAAATAADKADQVSQEESASGPDGHPRRADAVPKKKDGVKGDTEGWFSAAPIGSSISIPSGSHISTAETKPPSDSTAENTAAPTTKSVPGRRPKPASLGKNIQMFLEQQQKKK